METAERVALDQVIRRLRAQFPDVPAATIALAVDEAHRRYDHSRVRSYLAILVEREVTDHLRALAAHPRASID